MGVEKVRIVIQHPQKNFLFSVDAEGNIYEYPVGSGIIGKVFETGQYLNKNNGYADPAFNG